MPDSVKARQVADAWRAARESVAVRYRELAERKDHREWMPPAEFRRYCDLRDVLHRADTMTSQAGRLRVLATVAP